MFRLVIAIDQRKEYASEDVQADYEVLKNGGKRLEDIAKHFCNGERDMWYLGMNAEYKGG